MQLASSGECRITALVERDRSRAEQLAERLAVQSAQDPPVVLSDYNALLPPAASLADAAVIGLPNHLHAPVSIELLESGLHALVEKPIANSSAECDAMIVAADKGGAILAVGHMRRFSYAGRFCKWAIESGLLGTVQSFDIQNGFEYAWPVTTDYLLHREKAGGGALIDLGIHTLDQVLWWLGDVRSFEYWDDNYGGVEADCRLELVMQCGAKGVVEISRTRNLRETAILRGTLAELEVGLVQNTVSLRWDPAAARQDAHTVKSDTTGVVGHAIWSSEPELPETKVANLIAAEHRDFIAAIRTGRAPAVSGAEARRSLALVEACYAQRQLWRLPWIERGAD
jgi:predicted dehydrogenase